jgi:N-acyl-D-amino-acid deacylase
MANALLDFPENRFALGRSELKMSEEPLDLSISGLIYDGLGNLPQFGIIGIRNGVIVSIGDEKMTSREHIDATGFAIAPGFIDVHTHSDISLLHDGRGESKVFQGVTTEVTGNCSFSAFPINQANKQIHSEFLEGIGDDPFPLEWSDLNGYREAIYKNGVSINIAPLVGHGTLRIAGMGLKEGAPTPEDLERMGQLLRVALEQGAFGMSTGLTYVPSRYAPFDELIYLCTVIKSKDRIYTSHARDYDILGEDQFLGSLKEALSLARQTGVRVQYSHAAINDPKQWGRAQEWVDYFDSPDAKNLDVAFDVYPYDASSSSLTQYLPGWVQAGGVDEMRARLSDPSIFSTAAQELSLGWSAHKIPWFWDRVLIARGNDLLGVENGDSIEIAAKKLGMAPETLVLELTRLGGNSVMVVLFYRTDEDMRVFARSKYSMICSDGSAFPFDQKGKLPHPRSFGASARALGYLSRETGDMALEVVIYKMSGKAAAFFGIHDRGSIEVGKAADIVIFNPVTIKDQATFTNPAQPPVGIEYVFVNGQLVIKKGTQTDKRPGKVLDANLPTPK